VPANISDVSSLVATGRLPIDMVLLQVGGPDERGQYNAGLGIEHLHAAIGWARLVIAQVNPEPPWTNGDTGEFLYSIKRNGTLPFFSLKTARSMISR
jgi:acyl-CoA hydrolase